MVLLANGKTTYCVRALIEVTENVLHTINCLLGSGTQPKVSRRKFPSSLVD